MMEEDKEDVKKIINDWDTTHSINCGKLIEIYSREFNTIAVICCRCKGDIQRAIDKLRTIKNG